MNRKVAILSLLIGLALVFSFRSGLAAASLKVGYQAGNMKFAKTIAETDRNYLGLQSSGPFTLKDIQADYVLGAVSNSDAAVNRWRAAYKVPYALVPDPEGQIAGDLDITGTPTTVVLDKKGTVLILHDGVFGDANKAFNQLKAKLK